MFIPPHAFNNKSDEEKRKEERLKLDRPHTCEWCGHEKAYIGLNIIECSNPACPKCVPFKLPEDKKEEDENDGSTGADL